jgi:alpha-tubulin suppressor-like RCC1 family protein
VWGWGHNGYGQLGDNTVVNKSSPVQTVTFTSDWKSYSCGFGAAAGIKTDGTLWTWGCNKYGQLGDNTTVHKSSPVQTVCGGNTWIKVSIGYNTLAIKSDGTLWVWGLNSSGHLGDNTTVDKSSPIQTILGATNWKTIATTNVTNNTKSYSTCGYIYRVDPTI